MKIVWDIISSINNSIRTNDVLRFNEYIFMIILSIIGIIPVNLMLTST